VENEAASFELNTTVAPDKGAPSSRTLTTNGAGAASATDTICPSPDTSWRVFTVVGVVPVLLELWHPARKANTTRDATSGFITLVSND
jgi:hypothetical protein